MTALYFSKNITKNFPKKYSNENRKETFEGMYKKMSEFAVIN